MIIYNFENTDPFLFIIILDYPKYQPVWFFQVAGKLAGSISFQ